jgi:hypothetical protein
MFTAINPRAGAEFWYLWTVILPRRSITGRLGTAACGAGMTGAADNTRNSSSTIRMENDAGFS